MNRSTAIRCLILLGLKEVHFNVVDPKDKTTFNGETLPLLKFFKRATVQRWLAEGTGRNAKLRQPGTYKSNKPAHQPTKAAVNAAVERAIARSKHIKAS